MRLPVDQRILRMAHGSMPQLEEWNDKELDEAFATSLSQLLADREYSKTLSEEEAESWEFGLALSASAVVGQETVPDRFHDAPEEDSDASEERFELALALSASLVDQRTVLDPAEGEPSAKRRRL